MCTFKKVSAKPFSSLLWVPKLIHSKRKCGQKYVQWLSNENIVLKYNMELYANTRSCSNHFSTALLIFFFFFNEYYFNFYIFILCHRASFWSLLWTKIYFSLCLFLWVLVWEKIKFRLGGKQSKTKKVFAV